MEKVRSTSSSHDRKGESGRASSSRFLKTAIVAVLLSSPVILSAPSHAAANPHGAYSVVTQGCKSCHATHDSPSEGLPLLPGASISAFCYTCHDGTGSSFNALEQFQAASVESSHNMQVGAFECASCHTPHQGPAEFNPRSLDSGPSRESTGSIVCAGCHGTSSALVGGDVYGRVIATAHETSVPLPPSGTAVRCIACHLPHGSSNQALITGAVKGASGTTRTVVATLGSGARPLCEGCHDIASTLYKGPSSYSLTRHAAVTTTTLAETIRPDSLQTPAASTTPQPAGDCQGCHDVHGTGRDFYLRAAGDALCRACHDSPSASHPATYSYQGVAAFGTFAHVSLTQTRSGAPDASQCVVCHAVHGGGSPSADGTSPAGLLWRPEGELCTGSGNGGCHADPANSSAGIDVLAALEASTDPTAHHDVRTVDQISSGSRVDCSDCHNPHVDGVRKYADPDSIATSMTPGFKRFVSPAGEVFALVAAEHDGVPPVIAPASLVVTPTGGGMRIDWTTNELATSWIDWGTTTLYELGSVGTTLPLLSSHSVVATPVTPGIDYHFRVRTADALGNQTTSLDSLFNTGVVISGEPTPVPQPDYLTGVNGTAVTLQWGSVTINDGHTPEYFVELQKSGVTILTTGWITATSYTTPRLGFGSYSWTVIARDPVHLNARSGPTPPDVFSIDFWGMLLQAPRVWLASLFGLPSPRSPAVPDPGGVEVAQLPRSAATAPFLPEYSSAEHYSVNTDRIGLQLRRRDQAPTSWTPAVGWECSGTASAPPTPSAPGTLVSAGRLASGTTSDGAYWTTDLANADRNLNYQMVRFDLGAGADLTNHELVLRWRGHGEPTPGYKTSLMLWNRQTSAWEQVATGSALGGDVVLPTTVVTSVTNAFCLACHDGAPPSQVVMTSTVTSISAYWTSAAPSDFHGPRVGAGAGVSAGGLSEFYSRGGEVPCAVCHDPHGTANPYMAPSHVNGTATAGTAGGNRISEMCHACHTGTTQSWHAGCEGCHDSYNYDPLANHNDPNVDFSDSANCRDCHRHGSETKWGGGGMLGAPGCARGYSHSGSCHTWRTTF
jgi:predicted CXXCH cytochrome family protein